MDNPLVNSFDVFDTLLARKVESPHGIFTIIENNFPFPNFTYYRGNAENNSDGTFDDIYKKFGELYNVDKETCDKLKEFELNTEMEYSYLIKNNCNRVKDGDILVSDMYLGEENIMKILKYHGFDKQVKLFASSNGKSSRTIWPKLQKDYNINLHLGDNEYSDVHSARSFGINAELSLEHAFNKTEIFFLNNNFRDFGLLIREFRHQNPFSASSLQYKLFNDQAKFNIPCLIMFSQSLYEIMMNEKRTKLLLLTRDGCLLIKIFKLLYPDIECLELESSRKIHDFPNEEYKTYLKNNYDPKTCLISDLYGNFISGRKIYKSLFGCLPRVHLFGFNNTCGYSLEYDGLSYFSFQNIESFNCDTKGSLYKLENNVFYRYPLLEYSLKDAEIYKETVDEFCKFMTDKFMTCKVIFDNLKSVGSQFLQEINDRSNITCTNKAYLWNHPSLLEIADVEQCDKGSKINCGHKYIDYYEEILKSFIHEQKEIGMLELGLNRYNSNNISSFNMWKAIFGNNLNYYGYDNNKDFLKFTNSKEKINIYNDLSSCNQHFYDIIIDDECHSSKSQQIFLKCLWSNIKPGGYYCIESLHWQPDSDFGVKTKNLLQQWKNKILISSEFINNHEVNQIFNQIESINFYPSKSTKWSDQQKQNAFCVIKKKTNYSCSPIEVSNNLNNSNSTVFSYISNSNSNSNTKKILVYADSYWSMGSVHKNIAKYLKDDFEFFYYDWAEFTPEAIIPIIDNFDIILCNMMTLKRFKSANPNLSYKKFIFICHGYPEIIGYKCNEFEPLDFFPKEAIYSVTSMVIAPLFPKGLQVYPAYNGVELSDYVRKEKDGKIRKLGWCGKTTVLSKRSSLGFEIAAKADLLFSVAASLTFENLKIWYHNIDLLIITAGPEEWKETGPLPVYEAIASGTLVIGTRVGNFAKIPGPKFETVEEAVQIIEYLKLRPDYVKEIADQQYECVKKEWTYETVHLKWKELFLESLNK